MSEVFFNNKDNPVPQDLSLFEYKKQPIKIPSQDVINYDAFGDVIERKVDYGRKGQPVNADAVRDGGNPSGRYASQSTSFNNTDLGSKGKTVSSDPPEDYRDLNDALNDDQYYFRANNNSGIVESLDNNKNVISVGSSVDAKTNAKTTKPNFVEDLTKVQIDPVVNELNTFSSVTYNIALYMMNSKSYVNMTTQPNDPNFVLDPKNKVSQLLMRSGGTGIDNPNNDFNNNFFIDDLEIANIAVGPDKFTHNTNTTNIRFTITEPRGVTLLEKLQSLAGTVLASTREKYIHAPYLLEIKFKGYDETGRIMEAPSKPKYIPIRITDMKFEVNSSGTQYRVEAIPFANTIFGSIISSIPHNIELKASTVGDIFDSEVTASRKVADRIADNPALARAAGVAEGATITKTIKTKHRNLAEILTDSRRRRTLPTPGPEGGKPIEAAAERHDSYSFLIAEEISQAKLNIEDIYDALNTPASTDDAKKDEKNTDKKQYEAYVRGLSKGITLDKDTKTFSIAAGTDITKLINLVIMHSDYMDRNIEDNPTEYLKTGDPINWFKIRPVLDSASSAGGGYDNKDGRYKYAIKFVVEKNVIHYHDFPWAKKSKPVGLGYHKKYDYIFSGKNTEVLSFDLKFNTAFMQVMTAGTGSPFAQGAGTKSASLPFTSQVKELPSSSEGNIINSKDQLVRTRAKDLFSSVMSDGVDLVDLDLRIVGDPAWIPTSDAYWQDKVRRGESYTTPFMPDGTINYNLTPPFIQLNLRTPVDYDDTTGLQNPDQAGNSSFSGVYRISSVESTFSGGVFQQRLNGFRPPGQDADKAQFGRSNTQNKRIPELNPTFSDFTDNANDVIMKKSKNALANVVEDQFEDFDYDQFPEE